MNTFLCISMVQTQDPWPWAILNPGTFIRTNFVKDHLEMLHTKFQTSEHSCSKEEEFLLYSSAILELEPRTLWPRAILDLGTFISANLVEDHYAMVHIKFQASGARSFKKKTFNYFPMYFYGLNLGLPGLWPSWTLGPSFEQTW